MKNYNVTLFENFPVMEIVTEQNFAFKDVDNTEFEQLMKLAESRNLILIVQPYDIKNEVEINE